MKILAIETSTLTGSVALVENGRLLGEMTLSVSVQHSERLMPAVAQLLSDASVEMAQIDRIAVSVGPGSFTGLRIGIATAQGLALAHGIPVTGVSTLQGLAMNAGFFSGVIVPVVNAFRGEVYYGYYRATEEGVPVPDGEDAVAPLDDFVQAVAGLGEASLLVGNGLDVVGALAAERGLKATPPLFQSPRAAHIAFLASRLPSTEGALPLLPRYLRQPG